MLVTDQYVLHLVMFHIRLELQCVDNVSILLQRKQTSGYEIKDIMNTFGLETSFIFTHEIKKFQN